MLTPEDIARYDNIFEKLKDQPTSLSGGCAKEKWAAFSLQPETMMKVWALADVMRRGSLDVQEHRVAMHLISMARNGQEIPDTVPPGIVASAKQETRRAAACGATSCGAGSRTAAGRSRQSDRAVEPQRRRHRALQTNVRLGRHGRRGQGERRRQPAQSLGPPAPNFNADLAARGRQRGRPPRLSRVRPRVPHDYTPSQAANAGTDGSTARPVGLCKDNGAVTQSGAARATTAANANAGTGAGATTRAATATNAAAARAAVYHVQWHEC